MGTDASLAGDHNMVNASRISEAMNNPRMVSTNGKVTMTTARPMSQVIINRLRSQRSTSTPAIGPKKNPGAIRAASTRLSDAPSDPEPTRMASRLMASRPNQSPVADTTWASHRRKNCDDPNMRTCRPGRSPPSGTSRLGSSPSTNSSRSSCGSSPPG